MVYRLAIPNESPTLVLTNSTQDCLWFINRIQNQLKVTKKFRMPTGPGVFGWLAMWKSYQKEEGNQSAVSASGTLGMVISRTRSYDFLTIFYKCPLAIPKSGCHDHHWKETTSSACTFLHTHTYLGRFLSGWCGQMKDIEDRTRSSFWKGHHDQRTLWLIHITYKFPLPPNPRKIDGFLPPTHAITTSAYTTTALETEQAHGLGGQILGKMHDPLPQLMLKQIENDSCPITTNQTIQSPYEQFSKPLCHSNIVIGS